MASTDTDDKAHRVAVADGHTREKPFDNILNFRDVGKTINEFLGEKYASPL